MTDQPTMNIAPAQERLWFLEQLAPGSPLFNTAIALRLSGALELTTLGRCLAAVVRGQPILRTAFRVVDGQLQQAVQPCAAGCALLDLGGLPAITRADQAARLMRAFARRPFDLAHAPLLRTLLLRLDATTHLLLIAAHRMIADEASLHLVARELGERYAEVAGQPTPPKPTASYADFAARQSAWLASAAFDAQLAYWRAQLTDAAPILALPTDRPRPALQAIASELVPFRLSAALSTALQELSERAGVSLFVMLLAAFQTLLYRVTAQTDVIVGTPAANRADADVQRLVGPLADSLPLRANLAHTPSFHELITRVQQLWMAAQAHGTVPLASIVAALPLERSLSYTPLFQVTFELRPTLQSWSAGALTFQPLDAPIGASEFDLSLRMATVAHDITGEQLTGAFEYNVALFDPTTIQRLVGHWRGLLAGVAAPPDRSLADFAILTAAERQQLLCEWNDTGSGARGHLSGRVAKRPYEVRSESSDFWLLNAESACLHQLFEAQTARTPDAVAVVFELGDKETSRQGDKETTGRTTNDGSAFSVQLTYHELNRRANQLAHALKRRGVGVETRVGICIERKPAMLVALLGVLKAGAAYVPLDPAYPPERIAFMLEDAQVRVLITTKDEGRRTKDEETQPESLHDLGLMIDVLRASPAAIVNRKSKIVNADNLAYVIYTSGSTGRPKGVAISHRNAVALLSWAARVFPPAELKGVLAATSLCFDVSISELFLPLVCGGTVVLAANILDLPNLPWRAALTLISSVPTAMTELLRLGDLPASARSVNLGGEPLTRALAQQVYQQRGVRRVYNLYGPSETTTYATFALVERADSRAPTIGRPIANTHVYILDADMRPVPLGVVGELYIGGAGVTRGYLGRPELTAEKFVPNPFADGQGDKETSRQGDTEPEDAAEPQSAICNLQSAIGTRLYRTGDLVRYRADGQIEYLGRRDQQIKLRGYRIELGEIAALLGQHPAVQECVVVLRAAVASEQVLVAYVVPTTDDADSSIVRRPSSFVGELCSFLAARLPDYMLPATFVLLDALPRLPNGKIDQRALPQPEHTRSLGAQPFVAPHGPLESGLAAIWSDVLGLAPISLHDNFFELGGHSLLATQVISRIRQLFRVQLPLRALFETPTLAGLAHLIALAAPIELVPPITPVARDQALPLSFAQLPLWLLDQLTPGSPVYNVPLLFELHGALDLPALQRSLDEVIRRHEALRTTFSADGLFQVIAPAASPIWLIEDLRSLHESERRPRADERIAQAARQPFALGEGPLLRALLLRLDVQEHLLLLTIHHIVFDSWSATILLRELAAAYTAFSSDHPVTLPALPIQYADFACWQRERLRGAVLDESLAYWRAQLDGALPLDLSVRRASVQRSQGARQALPLPSDLFSALESLSRQARASLFMTLLASFMTLLQRYSGQSDLLIGTPSAGRDRADIEELIGFFVNMLPIRVDLAGNPRFSELLLRVREAALQAYAHQDVPFEQLVEALRSARDVGAHPLVQVVFALQDAPQAVELPQLSMRFVEEVETGTAKFDLTLVVEQRAPGPIAIVEYSCERFEAAMISRLLRHFQTLLLAIAANPTQRLAELPLLTPAERAECLTAWNDTRSAFPHTATLHGLFAAHAVQRPDAIALLSGDRHLTYAALDRRANRLARRLQALGVGPDVPVALCMDRSVEMIVGMLGALKAGGAYLPLDPAYPSERLNFMLDDAQARVLLTATNLQDKEIGRQGDKELETLLVSLSPCLRAVVDCPASAASAENVAHILYTSGSTGTPKGVVIPHRAVSRLVCGTNYMQLRADDRIAHVSSVSFDAATFEIWAALAHGAQLIVIDKELALAPQRFARALRDQRITTMLLTTALFNEVARQTPAAFRTIETLMFGGEAADAEQVRAVLRNGPPRRLLHMYGPTESTTYASWHEVRELPETAHSVTIGRPVANTQLYVLDRALQPVPIGVAGELYIGGAGLAHGYWQRPDLTAERFVPNPFAEMSGIGYRVLGAEPSDTRYPTPDTRLYKTGDLARYQDDGALEYLGRIDQQIKLRGFRIELGEIEAVLAQHTAVAQCIVVAHTSAAGPQLVAYVVPSETLNAERRTMNGPEWSSSAFSLQPSALAGDLRAFLKARLPSYMVPAAFVLLDAFPLTPNGKLDRAALPTPARDQADDSVIAPRTPVETALAALWAEVLDLAQVGIYDNFFDHGGHSLLGTQLLSRLHQLFQVELPLRSLFEAPTIAALATLIVKQQAAQADSQTLDAMLARLEDMSEEDVDALLAAGWPPDQVD